MNSDDNVTWDQKRAERERAEAEHRRQREAGFEPAIEIFRYEIRKCIAEKVSIQKTDSSRTDEIEALDRRIASHEASIYDLERRKLTPHDEYETENLIDENV